MLRSSIEDFRPKGKPPVTVGTAQRVRPRGSPGELPAGIGPTAVLGVIGSGAVAVVGLWWFDTAAVRGLGDWLTNAGRITGLLAGYAVIVLLALMARLPALERGVGSDRLARWHGMGGRYTVSLAVAHTLLIIWGYAVTAHTGLVDQTTSLLTTYPDVLMGTVALGLLVGVGIASARARGRMANQLRKAPRADLRVPVGRAWKGRHPGDRRPALRARR